MKHSRVLLMAGDSLVRLGLQTALASDTITVVGHAAGALDAIAKALTLQPDIVLLEVVGARADELETVREVASAAPQARIILLANRDEEAFLEQAVKYGVSAHVLKPTTATDLEWAVKAVQKGREFFSPGLTQHPCTPFTKILKPHLYDPLIELSSSPIETLLRRMIHQADLIRKLAKELAANIYFLRRHHPELVAKLKPRGLMSLLGASILKRLLSATFHRAKPAPGAAT